MRHVDKKEIVTHEQEKIQPQEADIENKEMV